MELEGGTTAEFCRIRVPELPEAQRGVARQVQTQANGPPSWLPAKRNGALAPVGFLYGHPAEVPSKSPIPSADEDDEQGGRCRVPFSPALCRGHLKLSSCVSSRHDSLPPSPAHHAPPVEDMSRCPSSEESGGPPSQACPASPRPSPDSGHAMVARSTFSESPSPAALADNFHALHSRNVLVEDTVEDDPVAPEGDRMQASDTSDDSSQEDADIIPTDFLEPSNTPAGNMLGIPCTQGRDLTTGSHSSPSAYPKVSVTSEDDSVEANSNPARDAFEDPASLERETVETSNVPLGVPVEDVPMGAADLESDVTRTTTTPEGDVKETPWYVFLEEPLRDLVKGMDYAGSSSARPSRFGCFFCECSFSSRLNQQSHIRRQHPLRMPFVCGQCNLRLATLGALEKHVQVHGRQHPCPQCGSWHASVRSVLTHINQQHAHTAATASSPPQPDKQRRLTAVRERLLFKCGVCRGTKFREGHDLSCHLMLMHTGDIEQAHLSRGRQDSLEKSRYPEKHLTPTKDCVKQASSHKRATPPYSKGVANRTASKSRATPPSPKGQANETASKSQVSTTASKARATPPSSKRQATSTTSKGRATSASTKGGATLASAKGRDTPASVKGQATTTTYTSRATPASTKGRATPASAKGQATRTTSTGRATPASTKGRATPASAKGQATRTTSTGRATSASTKGHATLASAKGRATPASAKGQATRTTSTSRATPASTKGHGTLASSKGKTSRVTSKSRAPGVPLIRSRCLSGTVPKSTTRKRLPSCVGDSPASKKARISLDAKTTRTGGSRSAKDAVPVMLPKKLSVGATTSRTLASQVAPRAGERLSAGWDASLEQTPAGNVVCPICYRQFAVHHRLRRHLSVHTGERPFKCRTCQKGFRLKYTRNKHCSIFRHKEATDEDPSPRKTRLIHQPEKLKVKIQANLAAPPSRVPGEPDVVQGGDGSLPEDARPGDSARPGGLRGDDVSMCKDTPSEVTAQLETPENALSEKKQHTHPSHRVNTNTDSPVRMSPHGAGEGLQDDEDVPDVGDVEPQSPCHGVPIIVTAVRSAASPEPQRGSPPVPSPGAPHAEGDEPSAGVPTQYASVSGRPAAINILPRENPSTSASSEFTEAVLEAPPVSRHVAVEDGIGGSPAALFARASTPVAELVYLPPRLDSVPLLREAGNQAVVDEPLDSTRGPLPAPSWCPASLAPHPDILEPVSGEREASSRTGGEAPVGAESLTEAGHVTHTYPPEAYELFYDEDQWASESFDSGYLTPLVASFSIVSSELPVLSAEDLRREIGPMVST